MTQDEIIEMARQAGCPLANMKPMYFTDKQLLLMLEAFAKLVAEHERKECEKIIWDADAWIGSDAKIWIVKSIQEARRKA